MSSGQKRHDGRVFGVGLNKTGTTSLAGALDALGYRTLHHGTTLHPAKRVQTGFERALAEGADPFRYVRGLKRFSAFLDIRAVERNFSYFDERVPGSKFILHTRDIDDWLRSREKHVERNRASGERGWQRIDIDAWKRLWHEHHDAVRSHFTGRPADLLEIDVTQRDAWEKLAPFLGCPIPESPFPMLNSAGQAEAGAGGPRPRGNLVAGARRAVRAIRSR